MRRPLIGITTRNSRDADSHPTVTIQNAYLNAISLAGGIGVPVASLTGADVLEDLYSRLDGILFTGGGDIALEHFHGAPHIDISGVDPARDTLEFSLLSACLRDKKPMLGICRGAQLMNVGMGGSLYTHIPDQLPNAQDHHPGRERTLIAHTVNLDEESIAAGIFGENLLHVNSLHHQGIKEIGEGLLPTGFASDGLVEVIEVLGHPFGLAVQWHPEWLLDQPAMQRLFSRFIDSCRKPA